MVNTFPSILDFAAFAPFIFRLAIVFWLINHSAEIGKNKGYPLFLKTLYTIGGLFILIGMYTQIASLLLILAMSLECFSKKDPMGNKDQNTINILILTILISLLVTGAGVFSFDIPL